MQLRNYLLHLKEKSIGYSGDRADIILEPAS
jgi:hypothetical protein